MEVRTYKDYEEQSAAAAELIIDCVRNKPDALLCFATGDSPKLAYQKVAERAVKENIDFSRCFMIGLDEWLGIPPANTGSCHWYLHEYLFKPINIDSSQVHLFDAMTKNEKDECRKMNKLIAVNGIDLMVVGIGMNGHIGFNEPGTSIDSLAHVASLDETTITVGQKYFNEKVTIEKGITVGLKQVMETETLIMLANGKKKAEVIKRAAEGEVNVDFPASLVQKHKSGFIIIDAEAASELKTEM
jgi:galactosamine-6-phosphate isomerase